MRTRCGAWGVGGRNYCCQAAIAVGLLLLHGCNSHSSSRAKPVKAAAAAAAALADSCSRRGAASAAGN